MKEPILLIMAAGMGSRYGGLKQMDPLGPAGEAIIDYSIYDAKRAGFKRVIFLIKHEIEEDFRRIIGSHIEPYMEVRYAFQQVDAIPAPFTVPADRKKPWGTAHAVLCCKELIDAPFAAINADDYYGIEAFRLAYQVLTGVDEQKAEYTMVGYHLENTLTDNGHVSRGVCAVDEEGRLLDICERTHIIKSCDGPLFTEDGVNYTLLPAKTPVSMNMWCFTPTLLQEISDKFTLFLEQALQTNPLKAEFYLPTVVDGMLKRGDAQVKVCSTPDVWYGVTYQEDRPVVKAALKRFADEGLYPAKLWN